MIITLTVSLACHGLNHLGLTELSCIDAEDIASLSNF